MACAVPDEGGRVDDRRRVEPDLQADADRGTAGRGSRRWPPTARGRAPSRRASAARPAATTIGSHGSTTLPKNASATDEHQQLDHQRDDEREHRGQHERLAREPDLLDQVGVGGQRGDAGGHAVGDEVPHQQAAEQPEGEDVDAGAVAGRRTCTRRKKLKTSVKTAIVASGLISDQPQPRTDPLYLPFSSRRVRFEQQLTGVAARSRPTLSAAPPQRWRTAATGRG